MQAWLCVHLFSAALLVAFVILSRFGEQVKAYSEFPVNSNKELRFLFHSYATVFLTENRDAAIVTELKPQGARISL